MKKIPLILLFVILINGCSLKKLDDSVGDNKLLGESKKILMVIAPADFRDVEYYTPRQIFEDNGYLVKTASIQKLYAIGADGGRVEVDLTVSEANPNDYVAAVFVGGPGMMQIINDETLQIAAKKFYQENKITAAICVASSILARAGILKDKNATGYSDVIDDLIAGGAKYKNESVVKDGLIITANGPEAAREFAKKIINVF